MIATARVGVRRTRRVLAALTLLAAVLFVAHGLRLWTSPFGDSHDGRNAAVWASGARSVVERGVVASRLGAWSPEYGVYIDHPPLILWQTAVTSWVGRGSVAADRAPAWIGSVVALWLLAKLLAERGIRPFAAGSAVVLVAATPMFLTYGGMLDTPITALPVALGLLLLWLRAVDGRPVRGWALAALSVAATLASWQALLTAGVVALWGAARLWRHRRGPGPRPASPVEPVTLERVPARQAVTSSHLAAASGLPPATALAEPVTLERVPARQAVTGSQPAAVATAAAAATAAVGGFLVGLAVLVAWMVWGGGGSLRPLLDIFLFRTGHAAESQGLAGLVTSQVQTVGVMFGGAVALLGMAGACVAVADRRTRTLALTSLAVTIPYTLAFPLGAVHHDYWNYWLLLPIALGIAVGAERLAARARHIPGERLVTAGATVTAVVLVLAAMVRPPDAERQIRRGVAAGRLVATAHLPAGQATAWFAGDVGSPPAWLGFATRLPTSRVFDADALAARHPLDVVFVGRPQCGPAPAAPTVTYALETATHLAHDPPVTSCRREG